MIFTSSHTNPEEYILSSTPEGLDSGKKRSNRVFLISVIMLMVFGVIAIYSSSAYYAVTNIGSSNYYMIEHLQKLAVAFLFMILASKIDYHKFARFSYFGIIVSWLLLISVLLFGNEISGARRWLQIGSISFQPSSLAILALLFHISVLIQRKQPYIKSLGRSTFPLFIWIFVTCFLIGLQDLSTACILLGLCLTIMFIGRINGKHLAVLFLIGSLLGTLLIMSSAERQSRVFEYVNQIVNIESDQLIRGEGYQAQQAQIAIAKGEWLGVGIGKSTQRNFLPAPFNDFIFAIIAEEYGMVGCLFILFLFTIILFQGLVIARDASDVLGCLIATAFTLTLVVYGFVNAGVATGLLPVTGLPMPFVSYGGTSLLSSGFMAGVLLNISKKYKRPTTV